MSSTKLDHLLKNNNPMVNNLSDWKLVKETFQKPSQIYKYLGRLYWKENPIYLNRTLSYVSKHRKRIRRSRRNVSIDSIAAKLSLNKKKTSPSTAAITKSSTRKSNSNNLPTKQNCDISNNELDSRPACYYNWICNDPSKTSQISKSIGFNCPWCLFDLHRIESLMIHLRCCHSRFKFNLVYDGGQPIIEMTINPSYDGSYCGFKYPGHDLRRDFKFRPDIPRRLTSSTQLIYFRPTRKLNQNIAHECLMDKLSKVSNSDVHRYDEGDLDVDGNSGRLYYHTSTCLPVKPNEVDRDSEADMDPDWLRERTQLMIDEFSDVNEGEKEILKLWNLHIMSDYKYKGDSMIRQACLDFVEREGPTIMSKRLYKNFTLHLANLYDYGLLSSSDILDCIRKLNKLKKPSVALSHVPPTKPNKIKSEKFNNEHCRLTPPAKRAVLNSHYNLAKSQN